MEVMPIDFTTSKKLDKWVENHRKQGCVSHAIAKYLYGEPQFLFEYQSKDGSICSSWYPASRYTVLND